MHLGSCQGGEAESWLPNVDLAVQLSACGHVLHCVVPAQQVAQLIRLGVGQRRL